MNLPCKWIYHDGGRRKAGFRGIEGDCSVRSAAIALDIPYKKVYSDICKLVPIGHHIGDGIRRETFDAYLSRHGCTWVPIMRIGAGCTVHLRAAELPSGRIIARCSGHYVCVIDGAIYDNHDSTREGNRCVYGYWTVPGKGSSI